MKFSELSVFFDYIEKISSRIEITKKLSELFSKLSPDEISCVCYLLQGRVAPPYEKIDFSMAEKSVAKSVIILFQIESSNFKAKLKEFGDIGKTVEFFKKEYQSLYCEDLEVKKVFELLYTITQQSGNGSQDAKHIILSEMIMKLDNLSSRYIARIPPGVLRLGFSDMTILDAFSWMLVGDKSLRKIIEKAYHVRPDLGYIGKILKENGIEGVKSIKPLIFTPILMMRAERLSSGIEIIEKIGKCAIEPKFDGFRLQAHYDKQKGVRLFTRGLEDVTNMYPDIVSSIHNEIDADSVIFEGEAIGFDPYTKSFLPFQETVQRKRKYDIEEKAKEIPLKMFAFDLLYCNGKNFISETYEKRREILEKIIKKNIDITSQTILPAESMIFETGETIEAFFDKSISDGLEGILAKKLDGVYQTGARGWNWIKLKRSYSSKINDTIDCVIMGYDKGKGKRTKFGIGAFLVGIFDEELEKYVTIAKIGTGLTDEEWKSLKNACEKDILDEKPNFYDVDNMMSVDVWVYPKIVVEIKADEITRSPVHTAGRLLKQSKSGSAYEVDVQGYALRFPRLERIRDDKSVKDITALGEIKNISK